MESEIKGSSTHGESVEAKPNGLLMHEDVQLSPEEKEAERRLVWKIDLIILPLLSLMYFLAALDRGDVGNAEVAGMGTELNLTPSQYSHCVSFFFIGYIVFQPPGQLLVRKIQPHIQLGTAMIGWGLCTTLICLAQNWQTVAGLRILIGCFEAFIQAAPLYLSIWYKREELATRGAIFFSMMAIAGSMNGLIAYGIQINMDYVHGWMAWRWIFLIEGVMSVGSGFFVMALLPPVPERVHRFFTEEEKQIAIRRSKQAYNTPHTKVNLKQLLVVLADRKVWIYAFLYSMMNISLSGVSSFLPLIVRSFGYSRVTTQILTIPVYIAAAISTIGFAVFSDRVRNRGNFLAVSFTIAALGWLFLIVGKSKGLSLAGCFLAAIGTYPTVVLIQAWQSSNVVGFTKRAGSLAFLMVFGQAFGVMEVEIFTDKPNYYRGKGFALGATAAAALVTPLLQLYLKRKNAQKLAKRDTDEAAAQRRLGIEEIGDEHPDFMYWL